MNYIHLVSAQFMTVSASNLQQKQYRITLNLSVLSDFNCIKLTHEKLFKLDED